MVVPMKDREYSTGLYWTTVFVEDLEAGFGGIDLYLRIDLSRTGQEESRRVASVYYWDASGHFCAETHGTDVLLPILEEVIELAKKCRTRAEWDQHCISCGLTFDD